MGWIPASVRQWKVVVNYWARLSITNSSMINKRIALWANSRSDNSKNWFYFVRKHLDHYNLKQYCDMSVPIAKHAIVKHLKEAMLLEFKNDWFNQINAIHGPSGRGGNKLRTYCTFKHEYSVEKYCSMIIPKVHRSALCKFRSGVAPLRIETGRYE